MTERELFIQRVGVLEEQLGRMKRHRDQLVSALDFGRKLLDQVCGERDDARRIARVGYYNAIAGFAEGHPKSFYRETGLDWTELPEWLTEAQG